MKFIYKNIINLLFKIIYGRIFISKNINKNFKIKKIKINSNNHISLYLIKKCRIFTDCQTNVAYIHKNQIIPNISYQQNGDQIANIKFNSTLKNGTPKVKFFFSGVIVSLLQGSSGSNYYHWLFDIIPRLEILKKNGYLKKVDFFYLPDLNKFIIETLKHYGIKKKQLINSKKFKHIYSDEVLVLEHPYFKKGTIASNFSRIPKWIPLLLKKKFLKHKRKFNCSNKVFIDRSDSKFIHFSIKNYKETKTFFENKGFKFYELSKLNLFKTIYLFNNAKIIAGPHGAGFANLVFCKKNTKVYEILPINESKRNVYSKISKLLKLKHHKLFTKNDKDFQIYLDFKLINKLFK